MSRIVVIDDEPRLLKTLGRFLAAEGHEVTTAESFAEVDDRLRPFGFDLLISDILLPDVRGTDVLRRVKERGCEEPVILMTGEPNFDSATAAVRHGAFDYLAKPVTKNELLAVVDRALRQLALLRERDRARRSEMSMLRSLARIGESAAALAHEIRSPISAINLALQVVADKLEQDAKEIITDLTASMERVERLMRKTLSFARPYLPDLEIVDLERVVRGALLEVKATGIAEGHRLEEIAEAELPPIPLDPEAIHEVVSNLVRNAIEAGEGRPVHVRVSLGKARRHPGLTLVVEDDGPGIPESTRHSLFDPFVTSKQNGTGLGLAVVRKIIEGHEGSIEVDRGELGGARFKVYLPLEQEGYG